MSKRFVVLLSLCFISALPAWPEPGPGGLILGWTRYSDFSAALTHITPSRRQLALSGALAGDVEDLAPLPNELRTMDGKVIAPTKTPEDLAEYWVGAAAQGFSGIAIDEFGHVDPDVNAKMAAALEIARRLQPHLFIAVWHAGRLTDELVDSYKKYADLVILESYISGKEDFAARFQRNLQSAREFGIVDKTVFGLGMNDEDPRVGTTMQPWANSVEELGAEISWIRDNAPEMPGIALFAPHASRDLQIAAYELVMESFGETSAN